MRGLVARLALAAALIITCASAWGAVVAADLRDGQVVFEEGVPYTDADRERLQQAADDLAERDFPSWFVVVRDRLDAPDLTATRLRGELAADIGMENVDGVFVLGPRQLGISAQALQAERAKALADERSTLQSDPIQGTINVARRLQDCDARIALDEPCGFLDQPVPAAADDGSRLPLYLLLAGVLVVGIVAFAIARRAAKRGAAARERAGEREVFEPILDVLSAQIVDVGDEVGAGPNAARARERYDTAVAAYGEVRDALAADAPFDDDAMRRRVRDGIQAALAARALLDGREPVEPAPALAGLCAFDPKHGRAVGRRSIVTPSGDAADVPVCAQCAGGLDRGATPSVRLVHISGHQVPYWHIQGFGGMFEAEGGDAMARLLDDALELGEMVSKLSR